MKRLMAANWKMYKTRGEAAAFFVEFAELTHAMGDVPADCEVAIFAPFTALAACADALAASIPGGRLRLGGQDCYPAAEGAYTGEISPAMLRDCGCSLVLTGHSERRAILGESDALVGRKTAFALDSGLDVVLCVGETLEERDSGKLEAVLQRQLREGLAAVPDDIAAERLSVAYEPVWAIGTGRVAGVPEILDAHGFVCGLLEGRFPRQGKEMRILYGGSVKPENAAEIIALDNVNGVLVGGASLQAKSFSRILG